MVGMVGQSGVSTSTVLVRKVPDDFAARGESSWKPVRSPKSVVVELALKKK